jgi:hypothetical protein
MTNRTAPPAALVSEPMVSEPQVKFILGLIQERDLASLAPEQIEWLDAFDAGTQCSRRKASDIITKLLTLPLKPKTAARENRTEDLPELPAGRYAVNNEDGELRFYVLDKPTQGRWAGYTFLSVQASDEKYPIKGFAAKKTIMEKIAEDPQAAMNRYGEEIGRCGVCNRTLTNQDSRARGIGPICAAKYREDYGWWS